MATTPRTPEHEQAAKPVPKPTGMDHGSESDEKDEFPEQTVVFEQRKRSAEIEKMGVEAWKAAHDDRNKENQPSQPKVVPGVTREGDDHRRGR